MKLLLILASLLPSLTWAGPPPISEVAQRAIPSVVSISSTRKSTSLGSGVIIDREGLIVTSHHVIEGATRISVNLNSGGPGYPAKVVAGDSRSDIALIRLTKLPPTPLPALPWGDSDRVRVGDTVIAVGSPFGFRHTVTSGILSARGRSGATIASITGSPGNHAPDVEDLLQMDAAINPGNSGGPLLNAQGEMVGLNAAIFSQTGGFMGIAFAIPSKTVRQIADELIKNGKLLRAWIGVTAQNLEPELAPLFAGSDGSGALLSDVRPGSPAQKAELQPGDILRAFDGSPIRDAAELKQAVNRSKIGKKVRLDILRSGKIQNTELVIAEQPPAGADLLPEPPIPTPSPTIQLARSGKELGLSTQNVPADLRELLLLPKKLGVLITQVTPESPAALAGLSTGDVILSVNQRNSESSDGLQASIKDWLTQKKPGPLLLLVQRGPGDRIFVALPVELTAAS